MRSWPTLVMAMIPLESHWKTQGRLLLLDLSPSLLMEMKGFCTSGSWRYSEETTVSKYVPKIKQWWLCSFYFVRYVLLVDEAERSLACFVSGDVAIQGSFRSRVRMFRE